MKNLKQLLLLSIFMFIVFLAGCATNVTTRKTGEVKLHTYSAGGANSVIIENRELTLIDTFGSSEEDQNLKAYIDSLGKPVRQIIISHSDDHHWIEADILFPEAEIYSIEASAIRENPKSNIMSVKELQDGKYSFDSVEYEFVTYKDLGAWVIKLPKEKTALIHHLGYAGFHVPLPPLDTRLDILKNLEKEGYTWFIGGHGKAIDSELFIKEVTNYNNFVKDAVTKYKTAAEAKEAIITQYPDWGGAALLDIFLPLFY